MRRTRPAISMPLACATLAVSAALAPDAAQAVDGCKFLLCIAGPWTRIAECRPPVQEVLRDLARGRPLPTCGMSGDGNFARNAWTSEPQCPAMYRNYGNEGEYAGCRYPGLISVNINGIRWSQVFWDFYGNTTTFYSDVAKSSMSQYPQSTSLDESFSNDLRNWNDQNALQCTASGGAVAFDSYGAFRNCITPHFGGESNGG